MLYFIGLCSMFPNRKDLRLPHAVTRLAEVISFLRMTIFWAIPRSRPAAPEARCWRRWESRGAAPTFNLLWAFGFGTEMGGDSLLGVRRVRRFTEKRRVRKSQIKRSGRPAKGTTQVMGR